LLLCVVQHKVSNQFFQEAAMDALERDLVIGNSTSGFLAANFVSWSVRLLQELHNILSWAELFWLHQ
jgi:hypothetical protein